MDHDEEVEQLVKVMIMEIMMVLYNNNIKEIHMGGLLRLLGVENEEAALRDNDLIQIDDKFAKYIESMNDLASVSANNQTLH